MYIVRQATYAEGPPSKAILITNFASVADQVKDWLAANVSHLAVDVQPAECIDDFDTFVSQYERQTAEAILERLSETDKQILKRHLNET